MASGGRSRCDRKRDSIMKELQEMHYKAEQAEEGKKDVAVNEYEVLEEKMRR